MSELPTGAPKPIDQPTRPPDMRQSAGTAANPMGSGGAMRAGIDKPLEGTRSADGSAGPVRSGTGSGTRGQSFADWYTSGRTDHPNQPSYANPSGSSGDGPKAIRPIHEVTVVGRPDNTGLRGAGNGIPFVMSDEARMARDTAEGTSRSTEGRMNFENPTYTVSEQVIVGSPPFEPNVSDPEALRIAEGKGRFEVGDVKAFLTGVANALKPFYFPDLPVDPHHARAEWFGRGLADALVAEAAGAAVTAVRVPLESGVKAYSVALEIKLKPGEIPAYVSDQTRRNLHRLGGQEEVAKKINEWRTSLNPETRAVGERMTELLKNPADWILHHDTEQKGVLQLIPRSQHVAAELQETLHVFLRPDGTRVRGGGYLRWGREY